jgi:hypothetical protein
MNDKYCIWVVFKIENFEKRPLPEGIGISYLNSIFDKKSKLQGIEQK